MRKVVLMLALVVAAVWMASPDAYAQSAGPEWLLIADPSGPTATGDQAMAYDAAHGRTVLFGGYYFDGTLHYLSETWVWDGSSWSALEPATAPTARTSSAMAYDSANELTVLFGGQGASGILADTWTWDGTTWAQLSPAQSPPRRYEHAMAYDSARGRVVLFGGYDFSGTSHFLSDTWEWNGTTWTAMAPAATPPARAGHALAFDSARGRVVLFGGRYDDATGTHYLGDTWEWDGTNWVETTPASGAPNPAARTDHAMAFDVATGKVVLFGGYYDGSSIHFLGDTWEWSGTAWAELDLSTSPAARYRHSMAYDASSDRVVLFGGEGSGGHLNDTWIYGPTGYCTGLADGTPCEEGNPCTTGDTCASGTCVGGGATSCDDGNPCTDEAGCDPELGCLYTNNTAACDNGTVCDGHEACSDGTCQPGTALNCDDGNLCTTDSCNATTGCVNANNFLTCNDGNACTVNDACSGGICTGATKSCDDGNLCTDDSCDPAAGCVNTANTAPCNDFSVCSTVDTCSGGICVGGGLVDCDDGEACTADFCDPALGCKQKNGNLDEEGVSLDRIDGLDLLVLADAWGSCQGDDSERYNEAANLDGNDSSPCIGGTDFHQFMNVFGHSCTSGVAR